KAIGRNKNGTYDYGVMQINSSWAKTLGRERWNALSDPCTNIKTGAWILRQCVDKFGYTWKAVGCYNSSTPSKGSVYAHKVYNALVNNRKNENKLDAIESAITKEMDNKYENSRSQ
ncbi:MAG: lytic transglycosylase domain-containing protein, partial [Desulfuromonadales bacterium]|nr:lytic transglycosylase domain-containing protein [Desulfuromonadales bacterium]